VIAARRLQRSFADGLITGEVEDLWEPWMRHADQALEDDALLALIQNELAKRCRKSKTRGRPATPVDVILRMMLLKHVRDWSYEVLTREVRRRRFHSPRRRGLRSHCHASNQCWR